DRLGKFDAKADDEYFLGYSFVSEAFRVFNRRRKQVEETYHVTFNESMKAIRFTNTLVDEIGIDDSTRYPLDEFLHEDDPSRQYQVDSNVSYYVIPHGRSLTELTQENDVPEVIAPNELDIPLIEDNEGPHDLINTEGTHEQNVQNEQIITQPTEGLICRKTYQTTLPPLNLVLIISRHPPPDNLVPIISHCHVASCHWTAVTGVSDSGTGRIATWHHVASTFQPRVSGVNSKTQPRLGSNSRPLAVVSYADLKASIEGYYEENIAHQDQTDKLVEASMSSLDRIHIAISDLYIGLNVITELLKDIKNVVKDDHVLNKKVIEATKAYTKNSSALTELLNLVKNFDFQGLKSLVESLKATALRQDEHLASWAKSLNFLAWNVGPRMTAVESSQAEIRSGISTLNPLKKCVANNTCYHEGPTNVDGQNVTQTTTEEPLSHTEGEHVAMKDEKVKEEPTREVTLIESSSKPPLIDPILEIHVPQIEGKGIATEEQLEFTKSLCLHQMTEVIKFVQEEAKKFRLDPKIIKSAKAGEKFKKARDVEHQVLKREHSQKAKRAWSSGRKEPEYRIFFTYVFGDQAFQRWIDIHKVGVDYLVSYLVMASMIKTQENARFSLKLRKLIVDHPDQEKLKSKKVKLEALGYHLD
nr:retrovirus-related Pol polyprotein from transposon TNT 1-94 [Tanacetum cinerariifolium]